MSELRQVSAYVTLNVYADHPASDDEVRAAYQDFLLEPNSLPAWADSAFVEAFDPIQRRLEILERRQEAVEARIRRATGE